MYDPSYAVLFGRFVASHLLYISLFLSLLIFFFSGKAQEPSHLRLSRRHQEQQRQRTVQDHESRHCLLFRVKGEAEHVKSIEIVT